MKNKDKWIPKRTGRNVDLCCGADKERWMPGTTGVDVDCQTLPGDPPVIEHDLRGGLPFMSNSIDQITCRFGFRYLWSTKEELSFQLWEARRVLKNGGRLIIQDVTEWWNPETLETEMHPYEFFQKILYSIMTEVMGTWSMSDDGDLLELETEAINPPGTFRPGEVYVWIFAKNPWGKG